MLRQNWIASSLNVWRRPRLPLGCPCQFIVGSSQMSSEPRDFSFVVHLPVGRAVLLWSWFHPVQATRPTRSALAEPDLRNKAVRRYAHLAPAHMARHAAVVDGLLRVTTRHSR